MDDRQQQPGQLDRPPEQDRLRDAPVSRLGWFWHIRHLRQHNHWPGACPGCHTVAAKQWQTRILGRVRRWSQLGLPECHHRNAELHGAEQRCLARRLLVGRRPVVGYLLRVDGAAIGRWLYLLPQHFVCLLPWQLGRYYKHFHDLARYIDDHHHHHNEADYNYYHDH
jgi:hypothetical protein